jgi:PEP-CTERM motif
MSSGRLYQASKRDSGSETMIRLSKLAFVTAILFFCGLATTAKADPITFSNVTALQNNGTTQIDLLSNPGVTLFGSQITFLVDIAGSLAPDTSTILQISFTEAGGTAIVQTFPIPLFEGVPPPYTQLFTINFTNVTFAGTPVTLTVSIPEFGSQTFTFVVAEPVPEPASIVLLSLGGLGLWARVRRRRT